MSNPIRVKSGSAVTMPTLALREFGFTTDTKRLFIGEGTTNLEIPVGLPKRTIILTAAGGWPSNTAGCSANTKVELAINKQNFYFLDFSGTIRQNAEWTVCMPDSWDGGTLTARFIWTSAAVTGGVVWGIEGVSYGDNEALDRAWGTAVVVTDTATSVANSKRTSVVSGAITLAGTPAAGEVVQLRVFRDPLHASDTMTGVARLKQVIIKWQANSWTD